jgi:hypothetical protein
MVDRFLRWVWDSVPTHLQVQVSVKVFFLMEEAANRADMEELKRKERKR